VSLAATIEIPAPVGSAAREIRDLTLAEAEQMLRSIGERPFRARQIMGWLWQRGAESFEAMTDLPGELRSWLASNWTLEAANARVIEVARSTDRTRKLLIRAGAEAIESVIIPADERTTLCISSQAGCAMGCEFCATARMGLQRNLGASEILSQILAARQYLAEGEKLTNYVFMGMGEPLANYPRLARALTIMTAPWGMGISARRITVSTVGLIPMMERLLTEFQANLAVSLHATTDELRDRIAPINRRYPLAELIEACRSLPLARRRRIMFEYVMLDGVNDSDVEARRLARMLGPLRAKVNLIFFNPFPGAAFAPSPRARVEAFQALLHRGNLTATIRESRGRDIAAACGQLFAEHDGDERAASLAQNAAQLTDDAVGG
jgi:23S rRNA (adenine2503-C2)-methyltransferase